MPPRMTTQSIGGQTAAPRGGRTGGRIGRGGGQTSDQNGQGGYRGIEANGGINEVPDFSTVIAQQLQDLLPTIIVKVGNHASNIQGDVRSVNVSNGQNGCSYKEFMACSPKDYDGKGGAIAYTRWIEKMGSVQDMSRRRANHKVQYTVGSFIGKELTWWNTQVQTRGREAAVGMTWEDFKVLMRKELCPNNEMQKLETEFWCHAMVEAGHAAYTDRFHELTRLVPHLVTPENKRIERYIYGLALQICVMVAAKKPTTIQCIVLKAGMLTDEEIRNGSLRKNAEKRGNGREPSRDGNVKDDNKRSRTGRAFTSTTNPVWREYTGVAPKAGTRIVNPVNARNLTTACETCFECDGKMDDPNITMEEYIRLEEEKAHRRGKVYKWETAAYDNIGYDEDVHELKSVETEFPAIVFNDTLTSEAALSYEPTCNTLEQR
ncbi:reverse transcriptase domain-containing protein [Tanacetum coccineum]